MPPGEYGEAVLVLTELLLDLSTHAFGLTLQHDENGPLTYLQYVQKALSEVIGAPVLLKVSIREQHDQTPRATHVHE